MLKQKIQQDLNGSVKKKEELKSSVLRMFLAVVLNKEKERRFKKHCMLFLPASEAKRQKEALASLSSLREFKIGQEKTDISEQDLQKESQLTDEEIIEIVFLEIKKRKEAILGYEKGGRKDLIEKEEKELEILRQYLPEQLSEQEIKKLAKEIIKKVGAKEQKDIGKVITELMSQTKGGAEPRTVSNIVKDLLISGL